MSQFKSYPVLPPIYNATPQRLPSIRDVMLQINTPPQPFVPPTGIARPALPQTLLSSLSIGLNSSGLSASSIGLHPSPLLLPNASHYASSSSSPPPSSSALQQQQQQQQNPIHHHPYSHSYPSQMQYSPPMTPSYCPPNPLLHYSVHPQNQQPYHHMDMSHHRLLHPPPPPPPPHHHSNNMHRHEEDPLVKRKTRNNLPKETTQMLLSWLQMHLSHPYPNLYEKRQLMQLTGLNQQQLSNWFINARRRKIKQISNS